MKPWMAFGLYGLLSLILFERGLHSLALEKEHLLQEKQLVLGQKLEALKQKERLLQVINCQNDPEWIEQTLMKVLGLVPEGTQKIIFRSP